MTNLKNNRRLTHLTLRQTCLARPRGPLSRGALFALLLIAGAAPFVAPRPVLAQSSTYEAALSRAAELERAGDPDAAAAALQPLEQRYLQDYTLQLRLAWLRFSAGDYARAEMTYRRVLVLSPDSLDAKNGLGWTLVKRGDCGAARARFQAVVVSSPHNKTASSGLASCPELSPVSGAPTVSLTGHAYQDHPLKTGALGLSATLPLRLLQHGLLAATYRYTRFWTVQGEGYDDGFEQHEAHLAAGVSFDRWGLTGHYSFATEDTGTVGDVHVAGLTARYSPWGDITLEASASLYDDMTMGRTALAWRLPLASWVSLTPMFYLQVANAPDGHVLMEDDTEVWLGGALTVAFRGEGWNAWLGGKYGPELRPAYLSGPPSVYNNYDELNWGLWAGGALGLGSGWSLFAAYEFAALTTQDSSGLDTDNYMHLVTVGASFSFGSTGGAARR